MPLPIVQARAQPRRRATSARRDGAGNRARILVAIQADPGIHVSQLAVRTGLAWRTILYHLRLLERHRLIQLDKDERERRAFPVGLPPAQRAWLAAVRDRKAAEVLRLLRQEPGQTIPGLSRRTGHSEKVVRRQMARLARVGLVRRRGQLRPVYDVSPAAEPALAEWLGWRGLGARPARAPRGGLPRAAPVWIDRR